MIKILHLIKQYNQLCLKNNFLRKSEAMYRHWWDELVSGLDDRINFKLIPTKELKKEGTTLNFYLR